MNSREFTSCFFSDKCGKISFRSFLFSRFSCEVRGLRGSEGCHEHLFPPSYSVMYCSLTFMPNDGNVSARAIGLTVLITE